jgi:hypothetical protein
VDKENSNRSLWISDGLRRPRSLSLSSLVSPSLPSSWFCSRDATCDAPPQRSSSRWVFYPLNQPASVISLSLTRFFLLQLSTTHPPAKSAAPVAPPSKRRLLQLPHLLLDVPNPSFLQLQMTWSSSCGRGRVSQVTGAEQLGGGGGGGVVAERGGATRGAPPMPDPGHLRPAVVLLPGSRSSGGSPSYLTRAVSPPPAVEMWLPRRAPQMDTDLPFPSARSSGYDGEIPCSMARWSSIRGTR